MFCYGLITCGVRSACMVPLCKGNGVKCECRNSRGVSLLSVAGKLYGSVLLKRVRAGTERATGEEHVVLGVAGTCMKYVLNWTVVF